MLGGEVKDFAESSCVKMATIHMLLVVSLYLGIASAFEKEVCEDLSFRCPSWKRYCNDPANEFYMKMNCRKTCNLCPKCEDTSFKCALTDCRDDRFKDFLAKHCRLKCGICTIPTTAPPAPPTPTWKVIPPGECGISGVQSGRIINGVDAKKGAWPWQVLIRFGDDTHCGGSIINPFWIVTAAHCVYEKEELSGYFEVVTGEDDFFVDEGTETSIGVSKVIAHENYDQMALDYDIGLIKLERPIPFGKYVRTVCLPAQNESVPVNSSCVISGWGKIHPFDDMYHKLQQARLPIVDNAVCKSLNTKTQGIEITDRMICAGNGPQDRTSGCHGDSGGPLVCQTGASGQWKLHGAVSWGSGGCDSGEAYTVFARISLLRDWIDQTIAKN